MSHPAHSRDRFGSRPETSGRRPRRARKSDGRWLHGDIPVIGLIGGIGAGKSRAADAFAVLGALVLDADLVGHSLLEQSPSRDLVLDRFGSSILAQQSERDDVDDPPPIDRKILGTMVFEDQSARRALEAILHPRMRRTFEKAIARATRKGLVGAVVLDAAILIEAGWDDLCDLVVFVDAPRDIRLARLASSRGWNAEALARRETAQLPLEAKRQRADEILTNSSDPDHLANAVKRFWSRHIGSRPRTNSTPRAPANRMTSNPDSTSDSG